MSGDRPARWQQSSSLLGLLALWLLATMGWRPLLLPDEGRYAEVARQMLHGDGLTPLLNGLPFFHKPPLMYWLDMAAMSVVGENAFAGRFGAFVGAWVMGAALFFATRRWHGERTARVALLVLATCPFFFFGAQYANLDMLVGGMITATVVAFARAFDEPRMNLRWLVVAWGFAALSVLAKGLIGFVLPALVVAPWLLAQRRWRDVPRALHPLALLVFAVVGLPWFVAMQLRYPGFYDYFIVEQHFRRFAASSFNNVQPMWFYVAVLPLLSLPWSGFAPAALKQAWRARLGPQAARIGFHVWWVVVVVGFFSLPSSKLVGYVLPALAPWCVLLALAATQRPVGVRWMAAGSALVCVLVVGVLANAGRVAAIWPSVKPLPSSRAVAAVLAARLQPGDRVVFVDEMFYDLPFYARLAEPVVVAGNWDPAFAQSRDNWRKELFDAGRFDPAKARELLWAIDRLGALACQGRATWFVVAADGVDKLRGVAGLTTVYSERRLTLLRAPAICGR